MGGTLPLQGSAIFTLLLVGCSLCAAQQHAQLRVPRIIHRNYMGGVAALQAAAAGPQPAFKAHWLASCTAHNPGWQEVVWDEAAVLKLMQEDFPWFVDTYLSYPRLVQRSDVMRYMVLFKYGGVYLDADVECYTSMEQSLLGQDLVLSCEEPGAWGQLHNAAMASTAGHPFWLAVLQEAMRRSPAALAESSGWAMHQLRTLWRSTPFHDGLLDVLRTTGPILLTDVYRRHTDGAPACGHTVTVDSSVSTAYPVGSWYTPCLCSDDDCLRRWNVQHFKLVEQQQRGDSTSAEQSSRWLQQQARQHQGKERRHRRRWQQRQQQQQQQHAQAVQVQELALEVLQVVGIHQYSGSWTGWDQSHRLLQQQQMQQEMSWHVLDHFTTSVAFLQPALATSSLPARSILAAPPAPASAAACEEYEFSEVIPHLTRALGTSQHSKCIAVAVTNPATASSINGISTDAQHTSCTGASHLGGVAGSAADSTGHNVSCHTRSQPAAAGQAGAFTTQLQQQLGCSVALVAPDAQSQWPAQPHNQPQPAAAAAGRTARASVHPGTLTRTLLQQSFTADEDVRHVLHFACGGCELPVLRELFALAAGSSALEHVRVLFIDVSLPESAGNHSSSSGSGSGGGSSSSSSSSSAHAGGWDEVYNLLHQQLGFKGFWRQQLGSNTLRLGWVREVIPAHAKLQPPVAAHAAAVLQAASARAPRAELQAVACDCCRTCCAASSDGTPQVGQLWECTACQLFGAAAATKQCRFLTPSPQCRKGDCWECCACKPRLWRLLQLWWRPHQASASSPPSSGSVWMWLSGSALPVLISFAVVAATGRALWVVQQAKQVARRKQAAANG